jgi:hypothetical protein
LSLLFDLKNDLNSQIQLRNNHGGHGVYWLGSAAIGKKIVEHGSRVVTRVDDEMIVLDACLKMVKHAKKI